MPFSLSFSPAFLFFFDSPTDKTFYFKYKKVFPAITAAVIKCLFPPVFILWKESEWKRCDPRAWQRWLCLFFFSQWGLCSHQIKLHKYSQTTWNVNLKAVWKLNVCAFTSTCFLPVWFTPALPQQRLMTASPDHQQPITTQSGSSTLVSAGSSPRRRAASQCRLFVLPESRQSGPWLTSLKTPETQKQKAKKKKEVWTHLLMQNVFLSFLIPIYIDSHLMDQINKWRKHIWYYVVNKKKKCDITPKTFHSSLIRCRGNGPHRRGKTCLPRYVGGTFSASTSRGRSHNNTC